jgi:hypothetical protein
MRRWVGGDPLLFGNRLGHTHGDWNSRHCRRLGDIWQRLIGGGHLTTHRRWDVRCLRMQSLFLGNQADLKCYLREGAGLGRTTRLLNETININSCRDINSCRNRSRAVRSRGRIRGSRRRSLLGSSPLRFGNPQKKRRRRWNGHAHGHRRQHVLLTFICGSGPLNGFGRLTANTVRQGGFQVCDASIQKGTESRLRSR